MFFPTFLNIDAGLGRRLREFAPKGLCQGFTLRGLHLTLRTHVHLVAHQNQGNVVCVFHSGYLVTELVGFVKR